MRRLQADGQRGDRRADSRHGPGRRPRPPASRMIGLVRAVSLPVLGNWDEEGPRMSPGSPLSLYWREQTAGNVRTCAGAIIAEATHHTAMRHAALQHDLLTVTQALEMPGGLLPLVQMQSGKVFGLHWTSYFMDRLYELAH